MLGDLHPLGFCGVCFGQGRDGLPLQREELLHVVEIDRGVLAEEVRGQGALVLLQRKSREGDGRPQLQEHVPDIVRVVVIAIRQPLQDVVLGLMRAEGEGLGLRQGDLATCQRRFHLVAQARQGQAALDGRCAQAVRAASSSRGSPSCISLANAEASSRGVRFSRWTFSTVARRRRRPRRGRNGCPPVRHNPPPCAALLQQLKGAIPALAADEAVAGFPALELDDHEVLQQAVRLDAGGKALDAGRVDRRARIALGRQNG